MSSVVVPARPWPTETHAPATLPPERSSTWPRTRTPPERSCSVSSCWGLLSAQVSRCVGTRARADAATTCLTGASSSSQKRPAISLVVQCRRRCSTNDRRAPAWTDAHTCAPATGLPRSSTTVPRIDAIYDWDASASLLTGWLARISLTSASLSASLSVSPGFWALISEYAAPSPATTAMTITKM